MNDDLGEIRHCYGVWFERTSKHSPERLWRAITNSDELTRWLGYPARVDLRIGGDYFADFARTGGGVMDGIIVKLEPGRLLRYAWGTSTVDWTIEPSDSGCRYVFAQHGLYPRPAGEEELVAGWHVWLEDLEQFMDTGAPSTQAEGEVRWREVGALYRPRLEAAVALAR